MKDIKSSETVTHFVIPTYDGSIQHTIIFTKDQAQQNPTTDAKVSDICIGASAAPLYFPAHGILVSDGVYSTPPQEFNLIGGISTNNPVSFSYFM